MFGKKFFSTVALSSATVSLVGSVRSVFAKPSEDDDFDFRKYFAPCRISDSRKAEILKMRGMPLLQEIVDAYHFSKADAEQFIQNLRDGDRKSADLGGADVHYTFSDSGCVKVKFVDTIVGAICFDLELNAQMVSSILKDADLSRITFKWN